MLAHPFDAAAGDYDRDFSHSLLGRWYRSTVLGHVVAEFVPEDRILDLGCGTGEDAAFMATLGMRVLAVDASSEMLAVARRKAEAAGVEERIQFVHGDLAALAASEDHECTGLLSNFGPLNCVEHLAPVAESLARRLRPGAPALFVVMGPWCPWEIAWYLLHGRPRTALRRLKRGLAAPVGGGRTIPVWYHSPRRFERAFRPFFERRKLVSLGAVLPPSYLSGLVARAPRFFRAMYTLDRHLGRLFPFNRLGDHYLMVMRRRG